MPTPIELRFDREARILFLKFDEHERPFELSYEFLRVHSPSAEVQGHRPEEAILQFGKRDVMITAVEPVGQYGIKPIFNDGHMTGIYTWDYLYKLATQHDRLWSQYLKALEDAGFSRNPAPSLPLANEV